MIDFRCWFCGKRYLVSDDRVGSVKPCSCGRRVKVPRRSGGRSRAWTAGEWLVETLVYGGGGALLGFGLGLVVVTRLPGPARQTTYLLAACTLAGLLFGTIGGERGIDWIGRRIRDWESRERYGRG